MISWNNKPERWGAFIHSACFHRNPLWNDSGMTISCLHCAIGAASRYHRSSSRMFAFRDNIQSGRWLYVPGVDSSVSDLALWFSAAEHLTNVKITLWSGSWFDAIHLAKGYKMSTPLVSVFSDGYKVFRFFFFCRMSAYSHRFYFSLLQRQKHTERFLVSPDLSFVLLIGRQTKVTIYLCTSARRLEYTTRLVAQTWPFSDIILCNSVDWYPKFLCPEDLLIDPHFDKLQILWHISVSHVLPDFYPDVDVIVF